ncbi:interleukin-1 receptor-like 2 [Sorex araneus]|uniref:interleukin-1 receptor-like 2 n=1 Tax=Sorex araneus TaxID=42254 RepID=UPI0003317526|nr:interleukin-1 receptor-like 2 [Sorex araneus]
MLSLLLWGVSIAFPLAITAEACKDSSIQNEVRSVGQPAAINCQDFQLMSGKANVTWYKYPSNTPISKNVSSRIHQEQTWILFVPLIWGDSGVYQCIVNDMTICHRIPVNLTVLSKDWCNTSGSSQQNLSNEYKQILHVGNYGKLVCYVEFPSSWIVKLIKWYKDCTEIIKRERFDALEKNLMVSNISTEDSGRYICVATLIHAKKSYTVQTSIAVTVTEEVVYGGKIPNIIYPKNNSIEVQLGSTLVVDCNITDVKGNTNPRSWKVNDTLVNDYYRDSTRIREGIEVPVYLREHNFYTVNITFLEVKMEDYGHPFTCHAGVAAAYFILKPPAPDFRAYLLGGLLGLMCVVVSVTCIYNVFKIDIVLWYRSAFSSTRTMEDGKLYDAYVLYPKAQENKSPEVNTLALKILPEVLERQCGYKLFIFGRDGIPGQAVANVIDENIKLCRRLIIVVVAESLSFELLKNMSEEQIAIYNALIHNGMKVILIEVDEATDYTALPESIQYIRRKHGALQWSGALTRQPQFAQSKFWKKVRYHMPPRRCPPSPPVQLLTHTPCDRTAG